MNELNFGSLFFLSYSVNKKNSLFLFTVYTVYLAVSFPTTGDDCDAILSLCFYNTLDEDSERKVMNERYFCTGKKTPSPSKKT